MQQQIRLRSVASVLCGVLVSAACGFDKLDGLSGGGSEVLLAGSAGTASGPADNALTDDTSRDDVTPTDTSTSGAGGQGGQGGSVVAYQQAGKGGSTTSAGGRPSGTSGSTGAGGARYFFCNLPPGAGGSSGGGNGGAGGESTNAGAGGETASAGANGEAGFGGSAGTPGDTFGVAVAGGGASGEGGSGGDDGFAGAAGSSSAGAGGSPAKVNITKVCYDQNAPAAERCTITASANNESPSSLQFDERPPKAFDGLVGSKWLTFWAPIDGTAPSGDVWIQVELPATAASQVMTSYALVSANDFADRDPRDFQVLGSNDGTAWTVLDTRCGIYWPNSERFYRLTFVPQKSGAYRFYRLLIGNNGGNRDTIRHNGITQLAEFELYAQ